MDKFDTIVQLVRNKAILKAQQEMDRKAREASYSAGTFARITPSYPSGKEYDACMEAVADAAVDRLVKFLIDVAV